MKRFFLVLALFCLPLSADDAIRISADRSDYDGEHLQLSGNVFVEHAFGRVTADRAIAPYHQGQRDRRVTLEDNVRITLSDGGTLFCGKAVLDGRTLLGVFRSNDSQKKVSYRGYIEDGQGKLMPLEVTSAWMQLQLDCIGEAAQTVVQTIEAQGQVFIKFGEDVLAFADEAIYRHAGFLCPDTDFPGTITLKPWLGSQCRVIHNKHDQVNADKIQIDTVLHSLSFHNASGHFLLMQEGVPSDRVLFKAQRIQWLEREEMLRMEGDVEVREREIGRVTTDKQLIAKFSQGNGQRQLSYLESPANTRISYNNSKRMGKHLVHCPGPILIDHSEKVVHLKGLGPQHQLHYRDRMGELYADRAILFYSGDGEEPEVDKLQLEGAVRVRNTAPLDPKDTSPVLQYALADEAVFLPHRDLLTMSSHSSRRVLFYDKMRNIQMSAPGIQIKRDGKTNKKSFEGLGDVRFTFAQQELDDMNKLFRFESDLIAEDQPFGDSRGR